MGGNGFTGRPTVGFTSCLTFASADSASARLIWEAASSNWLMRRLRLRAGWRCLGAPEPSEALERPDMSSDIPTTKS